MTRKYVALEHHSRVFAFLNRPSLNRGGRGHLSQTKVLRVSVSCLEELDNLIEDYKAKIAESPSSPRHDSLKLFLSELDNLLPKQVQTHIF